MAKQEKITTIINVDAPDVNPYQRILGLTLVERTIHALDRSEVDEIVLYAPNSGVALEKVIQKNKKWTANIIVVTALTEPAVAEMMEKKEDAHLLVFAEPLVVSPNYIQELIAQGSSTSILKNKENTLAFISKMATVPNADSIKGMIVQIEEKQLFKPSTDRYYCATIHNKQEFKNIKKTLMKSLIKPTDGWVSRNINRKISTLFSRALANTPITPNQISVGTMLIGLITGYYLAKGGYFYFLVGATMFQATSVLDGVDGELARLRFQQSDFGQWLDTIADNLTYVAALVGIIIGVYTNDSPQYIIWAGYIGLGMVFLTLVSQYLYLLRFDSGGSLLNIPYNFKKGETTFDKIMQYAEVFGRRDFFAFVFFIFGILGIMPFSLVYVSMMVTIVFAFSLQAHFTATKQKKAVANS